MKAKIFSISIFALLLSCITLKAQFGGGEGTFFDPYLIETPTHLNNIKLTDDDGAYLYLNAYFVQIGNIDLDVVPFNVDAGWEPIGTVDNPFTGSYDGYDYSINNLFINRPSESDIGLFGVTDGAGFYDIELVDVSIDGDENTGALAGSFLGGSTINAADHPYEALPQTFSSGSVSGNHQVGGLVGYADDGSLFRRCHSVCDVDGLDFVGGLVGKLDETDIIFCYALSTVTGSNDNVGGLVGRAYQSEITLSYTDCDLTGSGLHSGGLIGYLYDNSIVENCYSMGTVDGDGTTGGLTGYNNGSTITNCYSYCIVTGSGAYVGGLAGRNNSTISNSYWDTEVSGIAEPGPGEGRTTDEMTFPHSEDTYVDWNFAYPWVEDPDIGFGQFNEGYPYLEWQHNPQQFGFAGGSGTEADPYQISHPSHLNSVRARIYAFFVQTDDIDLGEAPWNEGTGWEPIGEGINIFAGHYDGANYQISNLTIDNPVDNLGLFGLVDGATITNVRLADVNITGNDRLGGLIGYPVNTDISNCFVSGVLNGNEYIGGLVGEINNSTTSTVIDCETNVSVSGEQFVGGLAGQTTDAIISACKTAGSVETSWNYIGGLIAYAISAQISYCSSAVVVTGNNSTGGLIGIQSSTTVNRCFSTGNISGDQSTGGLIGYNWNDCTVSNSYSRSEVSGNSTYLGGFAGNNRPGNTIENCYSTGVVNGLTASQGFIGQGSGTVSDCFWDTETSGDNGSTGGGEGRTTEEMKNIASFTNETTPDLTDAWDFTGNPFDDVADEDDWDIDGTLNDGYPFVSFQKERISWDGSENSDPENADNWGTGTVPGPTDNILILESATHNLEVDNLPGSPLELNSIFIKSGKAVTVNPGKALTVAGYMYNEGELELKCNETGTGSLIESSGVTATVERYIPQFSKGATGWHLLSSPVNSQNISAEFVDVVATPISSGIDFYYWNEIHNYWINIKAGNGNYNQGATWENFSNLANPAFIVGKGYFVAYNENITKDFTGLLNYGDKASGTGIPALTYTSGEGDGWNLIGNPYPSAIDWDLGTWGRSNVDATVYVYDGAAGQYKSWNGTSGALTDGIIPPMQGFFVKANAASPSITIPQASRTHNSQNYYKSSETVPDLFVLKVTGNNYEDEIYINFNDGASNGFDSQFDAYKLYGTEEAPQFYSILPDEILSINVLPHSNEEVLIPLGLEVGGSGEYVLSVKENTFWETVQIYLEDLKTGVTTEMKTTTEYAFTSNPNDNPERFILHFNGVNDIEEESQDTDDVRFYVYDNNLYIIDKELKNGTIQLFNMPGQLVMEKRYSNTVNAIELNLSKGYYVVRIITDKISISGKIYIE